MNARNDCALRLDLEGAISKRVDRAYSPGDREIWVKSKCLNRAEFVASAGPIRRESGPHIGAPLFSYYTPGDRLRFEAPLVP